MGVETGLQSAMPNSSTMSTQYWRWERECTLGTVTDDVDAQEPLGRTQVTKLEVLPQLLLHSLDRICGLGSDVQVVHIGRNDHPVPLAVKHKAHYAL